MTTARPIRMRRRFLLGLPALAAAAVTFVARPAQAKPRSAECVADLLGES
jgi:hypothetical protein